MVQKIPGTDEIDVTKLNPNDPEVYGNFNLLRMLPVDQQVIGIINRAQAGQSVGNETMNMEAILAGAGYQVTIDGQFSAEEQAALQHFEDQLNDKHFKEAGIELIKMVIGDNPVMPLTGPSGTTAAHTTPTQTAAAKMFMKLISDPM